MLPASLWWLTIAVLTLGQAFPPANAASLDMAWYQRSLVGMEVGPTGAQFGHSDTNDTRYCSKFDGRDIVRRCVAAHCEYVVIWARDGDYAYYDSKLLPKAPGLGARDPLREAVDEARRHKLPIIAYCVIQQGGHFQEAHPEIRMRGADGKLLGQFCFNSGYLEVLKQLIAEQLAYGVDGFHLDMPEHNFGPPYGCWCDTCRQQFEKVFSRPMPKGVAWDEDWDRMLEFRYRSSQRFELALTAYIRSLNPRATVDFNYFGNPPFSWEVGQRPVQHAGNGDFVTGETGLWGFSALTVGLNAEFYRAATPGQPVQVAISRDARVYHNQTVRPLADLRWEVFTLLAHGAFVTTVDKTAFDGGLDPLAYARIGEVQAEALARRMHFGQQPVAEVGIYFSSRTRDWFAREKASDYLQCFQGAHKAMVYEHLPWGVILDENVTLPTLQQFPIVLLPNAAILSENEVELLRRYVSEGGKLIVTGLGGCCDHWGKPQDKSSLESLTGAHFIRRLDSLDNWVRFSSPQTSKLQSQLMPEGQMDRPFLVKGPAIVCEATSAVPVGGLMKPYRTVRQQQGKEGTAWPMSAEAAVGPAILVNQLGKGMVLTFAGSPDFATASEHHIVEARQLLRNAVRLLNPQPRVQITAPATVEAVVSDDPVARTLRVHFIGYNAPPQTTPAKDRPYVLPGLIEEAPMFRASVELDRPVKRFKALNQSTVLKKNGKRVEAVVNDIHEMLLLTY